MQAGRPDGETTPEPREPSLAAWLAERLRRRGEPRREAGWPARRLAIVMAVLIAAGPMITILGANLLAARERGAAARLQAGLAPRIALAQAAESARRELALVLRRRTLAQLLEALARVLPTDARVVRLERTAQGALEFDIAAPDPDRLRMALRRAPEFAQVRNVGQRQADTGMVVSFLAGAE